MQGDVVVFEPVRLLLCSTEPVPGDRSQASGDPGGQLRDVFVLGRGLLPKARIRQWVMTLPFALRAPLAFDSTLLSSVLRCFVKAVQTFYQSEAASAGFDDARTGSVSAIQRFG